MANFNYLVGINIEVNSRVEPLLRAAPLAQPGGSGRLSGRKNAELSLEG